MDANPTTPIREVAMELWMDLLFGNPIGLLSVITVVGAIVIVGYIGVMLAIKSKPKHS
jgi:hypothetical protein